MVLSLNLPGFRGGDGKHVHELAASMCWAPVLATRTSGHPKTLQIDPSRKIWKLPKDSPPTFLSPGNQAVIAEILPSSTFDPEPLQL